MENLNWRLAYQSQIETHEKWYKDLREAGSSQRVELPSLKVRRVADLSDAQIKELARREAERDVHRAINTYNTKFGVRKK